MVILLKTIIIVIWALLTIPFSVMIAVGLEPKGKKQFDRNTVFLIIVGMIAWWSMYIVMVTNWKLSDVL